MKNEYLIQGIKTEKVFLAIDLPNGIERKLGKYPAEQGSLFLLSFTIKGNSLNSAKRLAKLCDCLPINENVRRLVDDTSKKFCETLFDSYCQFERGLRTALTLAMCAVKGNFDKLSISRLEKLNLNEFYQIYFTDKAFNSQLKLLVNNKGGQFQKQEIINAIDGMKENIVWDSLFGENDMAIVRSRFFDIRNIRNQIMHLHNMPLSTYEEARALLGQANDEIGVYVNRVMEDVNYQKFEADNARLAANRADENYATLFGSLDAYEAFENQLSNVNAIGSLSKSLASAMDINATAVTMESINTILSNMPKYDISNSVTSAMSQLSASMNASTISAIGQVQETLKGMTAAYKDAFSSAALAQMSSITEGARSFIADGLITGAAGISQYGSAAGDFTDADGDSDDSIAKGSVGPISIRGEDEGVDPLGNDGTEQQ